LVRQEVHRPAIIGGHSDSTILAALRRHLSLRCLSAQLQALLAIQTARALVIVTARMTNVDPQAWLADALARIATYPAHRLDELLPWNWTPKASAMTAAVA
jgi:hypothetical protein